MQLPWGIAWLRLGVQKESKCIRGTRHNDSGNDGYRLPRYVDLDRCPLPWIASKWCSSHLIAWIFRRCSRNEPTIQETTILERMYIDCHIASHRLSPPHLFKTSSFTFSMWLLLQRTVESEDTLWKVERTFHIFAAAAEANLPTKGRKVARSGRRESRCASIV